MKSFDTTTRRKKKDKAREKKDKYGKYSSKHVRQQEALMRKHNHTEKDKNKLKFEHNVYFK